MRSLSICKGLGEVFYSLRAECKSKAGKMYKNQRPSRRGGESQKPILARVKADSTERGEPGRALLLARQAGRPGGGE